jgi:diguanylate cyclase (GGDEF)-like protein/PAS domain S-box-containing protein
MSELYDSDVCRSVLESLPAGICLVDMQKKIILWSDGAERITGHPRYEVIGRSCISEALLHCDRQNCEWCSEDCPLACAIKTARPAEGVGFLHHKAGHEIPVHIRAVPVRNGHGLIIGAVEVFECQQPESSSDPHDRRTSPPTCVDGVTGVANRAVMQSHLREAVATLAETNLPISVLCFHLEGFDQFRARFGPEASSSLLRVVARTLESALWKTDFVGRWQDDEFLVILNGCRDDVLHMVRERVRRMLANDEIEWWGDKLSLPVSIGEAAAQPGDTVESLLERLQNSLNTASARRSGAAAASTGSQASGS